MSDESTIVSQGFKGGTRGAPIMPRDVSLSDSKCRNGRYEWVKTATYRKPPCSGQCLRLDSSVDEQYKINSVSRLLEFKIFSSYSISRTEISRLRKIFYQNCYPND